MKKIIILLFFIFLSCSCCDYKELNNLAIVSGIAIDFDNEKNNFKITFEVLNDDEASDNSKNDNRAYYVSGSGKTVTEAFNSTNLEISKILYLNHVKIMIMSEEIATKKSNQIIDYFIRNPNINNMFYMLVAKENDAKTILKSTSTANKVVSESLYTMIENTSSENLSLKINLEDFVDLNVNPMQDLYLPTVTKKNNKLKLEGIAIFNNKNELKDILSYSESQAINILLNKNRNAFYKYKCSSENGEDKYVIINIYKQKLKFNITNSNANININLLARIEENQCNYDLKDKNNYYKLQNKFNKIIKNDLDKTIETLINNDSDVLGINFKYYKNNNKKLNFKEINYNFKVNTSINRNGLIFEVKKK